MARSKGIEEACPFCGSYVTLALKVNRPSKYNGHNAVALYRVICTGCGACGGPATDGKTAVDKWNKRQPMKEKNKGGNHGQG